MTTKPEPLATIIDGRLQWHIPSPFYALPLMYMSGEHPLYSAAQFNAAIAEAVARERERCAKVCESTFQMWHHDLKALVDEPCFDTSAECAAAIRQEPKT